MGDPLARVSRFSVDPSEGSGGSRIPPERRGLCRDRSTAAWRRTCAFPSLVVRPTASVGRIRFCAASFSISRLPAEFACSDAQNSGDMATHLIGIGRLVFGGGSAVRAVRGLVGSGACASPRLAPIGPIPNPLPRLGPFCAASSEAARGLPPRGAFHAARGFGATARGGGLGAVERARGLASPGGEASAFASAQQQQQQRDMGTAGKSGAKMKSYSSLKRRFKLSASTGKYTRRRCGSAHLMSKKSKTQKRRLRLSTTTHSGYEKTMRRLGFKKQKFSCHTASAP